VGKTQRVTERFVEISYGKNLRAWTTILSLKYTIFLTVIYFVFTVQLKTQSIHDGKVNASLPAMYIFSQPILSISLPLKQRIAGFSLSLFFLYADLKNAIPVGNPLIL
jgi:hypothetical protein